jgi:hypothetical protein
VLRHVKAGLAIVEVCPVTQLAAHHEQPGVLK